MGKMDRRGERIKRNAGAPKGKQNQKEMGWAQEQTSEQEFLKKALQVENMAAEVVAQERESAAARSLLEAKGRKKIAEYIEEARQAQAAAQAAKKKGLLEFEGELLLLERCVEGW